MGETINSNQNKSGQEKSEREALCQCDKRGATHTLYENTDVEGDLFAINIKARNAVNQLR